MYYGILTIIQTCFFLNRSGLVWPLPLTLALAVLLAVPLPHSSLSNRRTSRNLTWCSDHFTYKSSSIVICTGNNSSQFLWNQGYQLHNSEKQEDTAAVKNQAAACG